METQEGRTRRQAPNLSRRRQHETGAINNMAHHLPDVTIRFSPITPYRPDKAMFRLDPDSPLTNASFNVREEIAKDHSAKMASALDAIISEAITAMIGAEWAICDLKGRLRSERFRGDTFETIYLDDAPILELHDVVFSHTHPSYEQGWVFRAERNYRILK
jgi:hypothetical protein